MGGYPPGRTVLAALGLAGGIGGAIEGDPWVLDNSEWLALQGLDFVSFVVAPMSVDDAGFGRFKARYRRRGAAGLSPGRAERAPP